MKTNKFNWDTINTALMNEGYSTSRIADILIAITKQNRKELEISKGIITIHSYSSIPLGQEIEQDGIKYKVVRNMEVNEVKLEKI